VPDIGLVVAGDAAYNDVHQYLAESGPQGRQDWLAALDIIEALDPRAVVAGHKRYGNDDNPRIIGETRQYIRDFDRLDKETTTAEELYGRCWRFTRTGSTPAHCGSRPSRQRPERASDKRARHVRSGRSSHCSLSMREITG
jgi:hypothetical protein